MRRRFSIRPGDSGLFQPEGEPCVWSGAKPGSGYVTIQISDASRICVDAEITPERAIRLAAELLMAATSRQGKA